MAKTIWKFRIKPGTPVRVPGGAEFLSVGAQGPDLVVWALVDPEEYAVETYFDVYGTGWACYAHPADFVGTAQMDNGLVFHVFRGR